MLAEDKMMLKNMLMEINDRCEDCGMKINISNTKAMVIGRKPKKIDMSTPVVPWLSYTPLDRGFVGSNPAGVDGFFFSELKNPEYDFRREVKPWVPCRRFTAHKRTSSRN